MSSRSQYFRTSGANSSDLKAFPLISDFLASEYSSDVNNERFLELEVSRFSITGVILPNLLATHFLMWSSLEFAFIIACFADFLLVIWLISFQLSVYFDIASVDCTFTISLTNFSSKIVPCAFWRELLHRWSFSRFRLVAFLVFSRALMTRESPKIGFFLLFFFAGRSSLNVYSFACIKCTYFSVTDSFSGHKLAYLFLIVTV